MPQYSLDNLKEFIPIVIFVLLLANTFLRKRRGERNPAEIALSLLADVKQNQHQMESFNYSKQAGKFRTASWGRNKNRIEFLGQGLQGSLAEAFDTADQFNRDIDSARKYKSSSYLASINVERLRRPLSASKQGLEDWLKDNMGKGHPARRGLFG